ncbi:sensor histidine kinase [Candidatus Marinarcus aquaticus]|uniref:histidine kinase n=1 Tax=Candidatus Marinarcus aquaticus TaxID=2044504 RepID=A0A4V1LP33_9BACT|nr:sensor histidine kinase [Candidatus Marinarcus aquaticus]RXJ58120.1 histidine kinase [Candidatus Marinarcus aquaticus]
MSIFKYLLFTLLFSLYLQAQTTNELLKDVYVSTNGKTFQSLDKLHKDFFKQKHTQLIVKVSLNKEALEHTHYYLRVDCNIKDLVSSNVNYTITNSYPIIKLHKDMNDTLLLHFNYNNRVPFLQLETFNAFEYEYIMKYEKTLFGITYGIIFCAFLYNFIFFLYNKEKAFLFYSLLQISLILILIINSMNIQIYKHGYNVSFLMDILSSITAILSILFNMEFLNTKKLTPTIHKFLIFVLCLPIIDLISLLIFNVCLLFRYIPSYIIILILLFSAIKVLSKGYKPAISYIVGWLSLFIFVFFTETSFTDNSQLYLLHIGIPLESLIFSFALGFKIQQIEIEKQQQETILINQSKLASMGEMIGNIAHQWRQPLTHLSYIIMNLKAAYETDNLDKKYLQKKTDEANHQIHFMSHTIDDFRNFFKVTKQKERFNVVATIHETINLLNESFKSCDIKLHFKYKNNIYLESYKGELSQVIFNLLNNAKDEFLKNKTTLPKITITLSKKEKNLLIKIADNAGGIDEHLLKKIFEPYFTTKEQGLGMGLYMSKIIIEKNMEGKLEVHNIKNGVEFLITLPMH